MKPRRNLRPRSHGPAKPALEMAWLAEDCRDRKQQKAMTPDELTDDELRLMRDLESRGGTAMISGNKSHKGLYRIVEAGYVDAKSAAIDTVIYTLTTAGKAALQMQTRTET